MAAIMFTDLVGYTALGQKNESLSLALVEEQRKLVRPILARNNGREVKTIGDAFLVEFPSALDAVRCSYEIQRATREFNVSIPDDRRIHLRVGVHLGDVVESGGDISGDAVNVASRIEALAEDGGVCLTRQVFDHVQNKLELTMVSLGTRMLKNVATPLEVYKLVMPWSQSEPVPPSRLDKKRIAVLPLTNISPDPADEYFADGLTEELISTVSKISELAVISRTSVMRYRRTTVPVSQIGRELSVGSVLEGSVRKAGNKLRITVQLIEVESDKHLWAQSYDRDLTDVFAIQADIAEVVARSLKVKLLSEERSSINRKATEDPEAYTLYLKGRNYLNERTRQGFEKASKYFEETIRRDPNYASAYTGLSDCYHLMENWGFMRPNIAWPKSKDYASRALDIDSSLAEAHTSMAMAVAITDWDWKSAESEYRRAISLNPSYATAHHWYAVHLLIAQKRWDEAIAQITQAYKLDPFSAVIATNLGRVMFVSGREEEGIQQYRTALEIAPNFAYAHLELGVALVRRKSIEQGIREIQEAINLSPDYVAANAGLAYAYGESDKLPAARNILDELRTRARNEYVPSTWIAGVHAVLGEIDEAFDLLGRAMADHSSTFPEYSLEPFFDHLRNDPRLQELFQGINLA